MALRILASEAVSSLGLRRAAPMFSGAQPQFLQIFSQNFASSTTCFAVYAALLGSRRHRCEPVPAFAVAKDVVYQDSHEWAKVEGETATVGISDFAQVATGLCTTCLDMHDTFCRFASTE